MDLKLGGLTVRISSSHNIFNWSDYRPFIIQSFQEPPLYFKVHWKIKSNRFLSAIRSPEWILEEEPGRAIFQHRDFKATIFLEQGRAQVEAFSKTALQSILRVLYSYFLPGSGALLVHSSGLARNGRAYAFPGKSTAGKTTIAKNSPGATLLSDEMVIFTPGNIDKPARAFGTPFYGTLEQPGENVQAPLQGLYFPVKAQENQLRPLGLRDALARLLPNIVFYSQQPERVQQVVDLATSLVETVPCYDLYFRPDPSFWELLRPPDSL